MSGPEASSNELVRYLAVPLRRWRVVATVVVLVMAAVVLYVMTTPRTYTATALVDLHQISTSPFDATKSSNQLIDVATEAKTATSQVVAAKASDLLSGHPSTTYLQKRVKVNAATGTTTLSIAFAASTAAESAAGANAFAKAYLDSRAMWADKRRQELIDTIDQSLDSLRSQLTKVNKSVASADPASAEAQDDLTTRTLLQQQFSDLTERRNALTGMSLDPGQVVSSALPGSAAVAPSRKVFVLGGLLIALILGFAAALARNALDRRIRSAAQLENLLDVGVVTSEHAHRAAAVQAVPDDAMYVLRSRVLSGLPEQNAEVLLVVDLSDASSMGAVGTQLAQLMANAGAAVRPIMITDTEVREQPRDELPLSRSGIRPVWLKVSDPDDVHEQRALQDEIRVAREEREIAVLIMVGTPRRSAIVANSAVANDVILVAQIGHTRIDTVRQTVQDVLGSGAALFAGVLVRPRGLGRRRASADRSAVTAAHATGRGGQAAMAAPVTPPGLAAQQPQHHGTDPRDGYAPEPATVSDFSSVRRIGPSSAAADNPPTVPMELRLNGTRSSSRLAAAKNPAAGEPEERAQ